MKNILLYKKILTLSLILCFSLSSYSQQNGKAHYKKTSNHNFEDIEGLDINPQIMSSFKSVNNTINNIEFILTFNDSLAIYEEIKNLGMEVKSSKSQFAKVFSGYDAPSYYNFKTKKIIQKQGSYLVEKNLTDYKWVLTKEKLIINDLTCYKATTTLIEHGRSGELIRPVVAWYTTDINLSAGPDGFGGLPGLIIQLEYNKVVTTLQKIEFSDKPIDIKLPAKGKKMTEAEFDALMKDMVENRGKYYDKN